MRGLKTQESSKFNRFFQLIQETAGKQGKVFFGFAGEGRDFTLPEMEGEDFSGWLIPKSLADEFEKEWNISNSMDHLEKWVDFFLWAEWHIENGAVTVQFQSYEE